MSPSVGEYKMRLLMTLYSRVCVFILHGTLMSSLKLLIVSVPALRR